MKRFSNTSLMRFQTRFLAPVAVLAGSLLLVSNASASVINTLLTGSTGTVTVSIANVVFNTDPEPGVGCTTATSILHGANCNSDVTTNTNLAFTGGPLATGEGIYINNADLAAGASATDMQSFLTFAGHSSLVFSESLIGPGSANTNCAAANSNGLSCSVFAGSPIVLTYLNGVTIASISVTGKASDTGTAGLATGSSYIGGFSETLTTLPNLTAPTPADVQAYFCPGGVCDATKTITTSQSGTFTASNVPEPSPVFLSSIGILMLLVGIGFRKSHRNRV
jgi:hypothetical protein